MSVPETIVPGADFVSAETSAPLPVGLVLRGRYRLLAAQGQGGFGITYRAEDADLKRIVAIKEYFPRQVAGRRPGVHAIAPHAAPGPRRFFQDGLTRFRREAQTLAGLDHPGIVKVFDVFDANGTVYLVMEFIDGEPLSGLIGRRGLPAEGIGELAEALLSALSALHAVGLVHCDIKPDNVMRDRSGRWVLIDFGSAKRARAPGRQTDPGTVPLAATPDYAAPELLKEHPEITPAADLYALAATLYAVATGRPPAGAIARLTAKSGGGGDLLTALAGLKMPGLSPGLARAVDEGLALAARDRPRDAVEMRSLLRSAGADSGLRSTLSAKPRPARRKAPWGAAVGLAALAALPFTLPAWNDAAMIEGGVLAGAGMALYGLRGRLGPLDCGLAALAAPAVSLVACRLFAADDAAGGFFAAIWTAAGATAGAAEWASMDTAALTLAGAALARLWFGIALRFGLMMGFLAASPGAALLGAFFSPSAEIAFSPAVAAALDGVAAVAGRSGVTLSRLWAAQGAFLALLTLAAARRGR